MDPFSRPTTPSGVQDLHGHGCWPQSHRSGLVPFRGFGQPPADVAPPQENFLHDSVLGFSGVCQNGWPQHPCSAQLHSAGSVWSAPHHCPGFAPATPSTMSRSMSTGGLTTPQSWPYLHDAHPGCCGLYSGMPCAPDMSGPSSPSCRGQGPPNGEAPQFMPCRTAAHLACGAPSPACASNSAHSGMDVGSCRANGQSQPQGPAAWAQSSVPARQPAPPVANVPPVRAQPAPAELASFPQNVACGQELSCDFVPQRVHQPPDPCHVPQECRAVDVPLPCQQWPGSQTAGHPDVSARSGGEMASVPHEMPWGHGLACRTAEAHPLETATGSARRSGAQMATALPHQVMRGCEPSVGRAGAWSQPSVSELADALPHEVPVAQGQAAGRTAGASVCDAMAVYGCGGVSPPAARPLMLTPTVFHFRSS